jgi:hypothetical protein
LPDPNLDTAYVLASGLLQPQDLPTSLNDVIVRATLVNEINSPFVVGDGPSSGITPLNRLDRREILLRLQKVAILSRSIIHDVNDDNIRTNIALRIWSGRMDASKSISFKTINGPISPQNRYLYFLCIDYLANRDLIYRAGVEGAPSFKRRLGQYYSSEGVPDSSPVQSYPNEYLLDG